VRAFLFPGQGSQTPGMGRDLYESRPDVRCYFDEAAARVPGLLQIMFEGPAESLARTQYAQPALLAVEAALTHILKQLGHEPAVCAGHSLGEFSALVAAEALTFPEALRLVEARGRLMAELVAPGGMAAVIGLSQEVIEKVLPSGAFIANLNGPDQTIISGGQDALKEAAAVLTQAGAKRVMPLQVSGPFHSPLMKQARDAFAELISTAVISDPKYPFVSSVNGKQMTKAEDIRQLLSDQICAPVQWTCVMSTIGTVPSVEVGPGRVLQGLCKRMKGGPDPVVSVGTLEACVTLEKLE